MSNYETGKHLNREFLSWGDMDGKEVCEKKFNISSHLGKC